MLTQIRKLTQARVAGALSSVFLTYGIALADNPKPNISAAHDNYSTSPAQLTLTGVGFGSVRPRVVIDGTPLFVMSYTDTVVVATLPASLAPGSYELTFTNQEHPGASMVTTFDVTLGASGPKGAKGDPGAAGPTGALGPKGDPGPVGAAGAAGPQGAKGDTGAVGATGPQGTKGDLGATGAAGPQGSKGDTGVAGPAGPQGLKGDAGVAGPAGAAGPQGLKGDAGAAGAAGPAGATGPQGNRGPQGTDGATGPAGNTGPQGPNGANGAPGAQGPGGAQGPQGPGGPMGPVGSQGPAGANGVSGYQLVTISSAIPANFYARAGVNCPGGKKVVGGGVFFTAEGTGLTAAELSKVTVWQSGPADDNTWSVGISNGNPTAIPVTFSATCVAAN